jgi:hypothetical protein
MSNTFFDFLLNIYFFKKINIPISLNIEFLFFNNLKFLILNNLYKQKFYFLIPFNLKFLFFNNSIIFIKNNFQNNYIYKYNRFFFFFFFKKIFNIQTLISKTIFIKGVGLRINFLEDSNNILKLKLGFSHFIYLNFTNNLFISIFKKKILIRSFNNILLGNFCNILYKFRPINIFTGKGLYIKKQKFKLKQYIKKI